jgi:hypothetical protein
LPAEGKCRGWFSNRVLELTTRCFGCAVRGLSCDLAVHSALGAGKLVEVSPGAANKITADLVEVEQTLALLHADMSSASADADFNKARALVSRLKKVC